MERMVTDAAASSFWEHAPVLLVFILVMGSMILGVVRSYKWLSNEIRAGIKEELKVLDKIIDKIDYIEKRVDRVEEELSFLIRTTGNTDTKH